MEILHRVSLQFSVYIYITITFALVLREVASTGLLNSDVDLKAPIAFKDLDGTKFRIYKRRVKWETAFLFCSRCVGQFATFDTPDIANTVRDAIYNFSHFSKEYDQGTKQDEFGLDRRYWIGLHDQKNVEGAWKWTKNTRQTPVDIVNYSQYPWFPNQPDHKSSGQMEHCGGFWNPVYHLDAPPTRFEKHHFNDMPCEQKYYFICEKLDPPPYIGPEPEYCKVPIAEKFGPFFGKEVVHTEEKSNTFLEKGSLFLTSTSTN